MSDEPISIDAEHPEYYAELLRKTTRLADWLPPDESNLSKTIPGVQGVDDRRLQTLLDVVADISLRQRRNVAATMASLEEEKGTVETQLYIVFDHQEDDAASRCRQHLESIFTMLRQVPCKSPGMKGIGTEFEDTVVNISKAIHNYSFEIFAHRVTKREHRLLDIQRYIEQDRARFNPEQRSALEKFFSHVDSIIEVVADAQATQQFSTLDIQMLFHIYDYWTHHNLLPRDGVADNKLTLLDNVDAWLADEYGIGFQLRRYALKIMSFVISTNRLFMLTQSRRLRSLLDGTFTVRVLTSPSTSPYRCNLSSETIKVALDAALSGTSYETDEWDEMRKSFIERVEEPNAEVFRRNPTVHAELAMITAMDKGEIQHVVPYIGVSKLSCIMCSHYIRTFKEITKQKIATKGSHGKAYPGWSWPSIPDRDAELRPAFLRVVRQQLRNDFEHHADTWRRLSDSSVGSGSPKLQLGSTEDSISDLRIRRRRARQVGL